MAGEAPEWPNLDLGHMPNERFVGRVFRLLRALPRVIRHSDALRGADIIIARNVDLLALGWIAKLCVAGRGTRLVYECLDIHGLMTRADGVGRVMRFCERFLLRRIDLLWTSSPGFLRNYFIPVQGYDGPHVVIENKLWFETAPPRPVAADRVTEPDRFILGWVGSIRCASSLALLAGAAARLGPKVEIKVHGGVHHHAVPEFEAVLSEHPNMSYHGPYRYPDDLAPIYLGCDAVWAQDLWQRGGNSDWLLPNRIYEAGWYGCPSIAVEDMETGRRVAADGLGFVVEDATADVLVDLLSRHSKQAFREVSERLLAMPDAMFRLDVSDVAAALEAIPGGAGGFVEKDQRDSVPGAQSR